jgi:hypothetical protein
VRSLERAEIRIVGGRLGIAAIPSVDHSLMDAMYGVLVSGFEALVANPWPCPILIKWGIYE